MHVFQLLHDEAPIQDLRVAGEWTGLLPVKDLFLVHIHDVELVGAPWKLALGVRLTLYLEEEPALVALCVRIRF